MTLPGVDLASFQGQPGQWDTAAGDYQWAAVKLTELQPSGVQYIDPVAVTDWAALKNKGKGRIAYLFGHPATPARETVDLFERVLRQLGLDDADAVCLDHEDNDGTTPEHAASWGCDVLTDLRSRFGRMPLLYTFRDFAEAGNCAGMGDHPLWISDPNSPAGHPVVPGPWQTWDIHQYATSGDLDKDVASYASLAAMAAALGKGSDKPKPKPTIPTTWQEAMMAKLPELKTGSTGEPVKTVQGLCRARGHMIAIDGTYGTITEAAVKQVQTSAKVKADGVVGPATWPALLDIA